MDDLVLDSFDIRSPKFIENPYPFYEYLLNNEPIKKTEIFGDAWLISRYDIVKLILKSPQFTNDTLAFLFGSFSEEEQKILKPFYEFHKTWLPYLHGHQHNEARKIIHEGFEVAMEIYGPKYVQYAEELVKNISNHNSIDFMAQFACKFPAYVMCHILGVIDEDMPKLINWVETYHKLIMSDRPTFCQAMAASNAVFSIKNYFSDLVKQPLLIRKSSVVEQLVNQPLQYCDRDLLLGQLVILLIGGYANTHNVLGNGLVLLLKHPDKLHELQENPNLIPTAVRELIRFDTSSQLTPRMALEDVTIEGTLIRKNELIFLLMGAANRDPLIFDEPNKLNLSRKKNPQITFGAGEHTCIGLHLTLQIAEWAFNALIKIADKMVLLESALIRIPSFIFRGYERIPLNIITSEI